MFFLQNISEDSRFWFCLLAANLQHAFLIDLTFLRTFVQRKTFPEEANVRLTLDVDATKGLFGTEFTGHTTGLDVTGTNFEQVTDLCD